jgi:hypothetical protein
MVHVAVLPIELVSLEAVSDEGRVGLHWATSSESNNDHFNVLRSSNAVDWSSIGMLQARDLVGGLACTGKGGHA